jgi:hypothetical protein
MKLVSRFLSIAQEIKQQGMYFVRRKYIFPEDQYKRGLLKRLQKAFQYDYFVETGTFEGKTPYFLRSHFKKIWTIELDDALYARAGRLLAPFDHIYVLHGDSKDKLKEVVPLVDRPAIFWLDGHYSGAGTAKGPIAAPLAQELNVIANSPIKNHVIVIDDASDFCLKEGNEQLSNILAILERINKDYKFYFDYDMLFALPHENQHRYFWRRIVYPFVIR